MAYFLDPEHWTIRGGPEAVRFGRPYACSVQGQVQRDRVFYLHNAVGDLAPTDALGVLQQLRELAKVYGWTGIEWERRSDYGSPRKVIVPVRRKDAA